MEKIYDLCRRYGDYAPLAIRLGVGIVFLLFSFQKLSVPGQTTAEIGQLFGVSLGMSSVANFYTGILEGLSGLGLVMGYQTRLFAFLATGMVTVIFSSIMLKYGLKNDPNIYRDVGLIGASIALLLLGAGGLSVDRFIEKKKGMAQPVGGESSVSPKKDERVKPTDEFTMPPSKLNM